jgi:hypothetical protein
MKTKGNGKWRVTSGENASQIPPPRVFCEKRLYFIDFEGVKYFRDDKEAVIY